MTTDNHEKDRASEKKPAEEPRPLTQSEAFTAKLVGIIIGAFIVAWLFDSL